MRRSDQRVKRKQLGGHSGPTPEGRVSRGSCPDPTREHFITSSLNLTRPVRVRTLLDPTRPATFGTSRDLIRGSGHDPREAQKIKKINTSFRLSDCGKSIKCFTHLLHERLQVKQDREETTNVTAIAN